MQIKVKPMGVYQTNCYILSSKSADIIIDPGVDATEWISKNVKNPIAILNTHGHFDHVWSNAEVSKKYNIPIYCPKDDTFMLEKDPFGYNVPKSKADYKIEPNRKVKIDTFEFTFLHFPGHTPGCSVIEFKDTWFSGDFLFNGSIGRWDFKYSNKQDMLNSLNSVKKFTKTDKIVLPGHDRKTTLFRELKHIDYWINVVKKS